VSSLATKWHGRFCKLRDASNTRITPLLETLASAMITNIVMDRWRIACSGESGTSVCAIRPTSERIPKHERVHAKHFLGRRGGLFQHHLSQGKREFAYAQIVV